jgi:hypothetical protein
MKTLYTFLLALGLAFTANAQNYFYQLDSSFNGKGYRLFASTSGTDNVQINACYLNDDKTSYITGDYGPTLLNHYIYGTRLKVNGEIDSTLCGSYCVSNSTMAGSHINMFKLQNNYYMPHTGLGGVSYRWFKSNNNGFSNL